MKNYFTVKEFEKSATAEKLKISNTLPSDKLLNVLYLIDKVLNPIREKYGKCITISSGYRCPALNKAVGGVANSQHLADNDSAAADIDVGNKVDNKELFNLIKEMINKKEIIVDQIIDEKNFDWIHISVKRLGENRNQIFKL
jgi:hypothetical protein